MIDTHAHLIASDTKAYPPAPPSGEIRLSELDDPMTAERLLREMDANGVDKAVLVQRGSIYGFDSSYVCDCAALYPDRFVSVCSIDATHPDCGEMVRHWVQDRGAAGIRFMELIKGTDISWLDSPTARDAWNAAAQLDAPVCVHLFPWNRAEGLTRLEAILSAVPGLNVVIDHLSAMRSDAGPPDHGVDDLLKAVAAYEGVSIKFTTIPLGRLDEAGVDVAPIMRRVMDLFGPERMIWGSDVTQSPGTYEDMVALGHRAVASMSSTEREQVLNGTAMRIYGKSWAKNRQIVS